jgi:hypothetical protein
MAYYSMFCFSMRTDDLRYVLRARLLLLIPIYIQKRHSHLNARKYGSNLARVFTLHIHKIVSKPASLYRVAAYSMEVTVYSLTPPGVETITISPALCPSSAFPTGDSLEIRPEPGSASKAPTNL